ncbi:MAG: LysM peptidoglycan-binding domain-containing protein [Actinomycetota bacterium]|nr:LysM peptidoglycan-binding domain-containing protein [Actinomycetota bacterium]
MAIAIPLAPARRPVRTTSAVRSVRTAVRTSPRVPTVRASPRVPTVRASRPSKQASQLTRRGRLVVLFGGVIALFSAMLMFGQIASATITNQGPATAVVVVQPGETLWSIAQSVAPSADPRETVSRIRDLNGMTSAVVIKGQSLIVPVIN